MKHIKNLIPRYIREGSVLFEYNAQQQSIFINRLGTEPKLFYQTKDQALAWEVFESLLVFQELYGEQSLIRFTTELTNKWQRA